MSKINDERFRTVRVENLSKVNIGDFCKSIMMVHGANVNISRAIPDARDGLKPVARRILYDMYKNEKMTPTSKKVKVAKVVGSTMGNYHPHGDTSLSGVITNLGSYWKTNPLLIRPDGNYGSINGDSPSAMRYIECGMPQFTWDCFFSEWEDELVDFRPNYSGTLQEPEFLPSKYPLILFEGTSGLGYGLYSGIPSNNVNESCDLVIELIKNPNKKKVYLVPDFPNGCDIVDNDFYTICEKGNGAIRLRGHMEVNDKGNIVIRSIPFQTTIEKIIEEQIPALVNSEKLIGIMDVMERSEVVETKIHGNKIPLLDIYIELILKKGANPNHIMEVLYKSTMLEDTFSVNLEMVYDYDNIHYSLKSYILEWIEFRRDTKRRLYLHKYSSMNKRYIMLTCIVNILSKKNSDSINMNIVRGSKNRIEVISNLMKEWDISDLEADVIADFKQYQYSKDSLKKFKDEKDYIELNMKELHNIIHDDTLLDRVIIDELKDCKRKYGSPRKCRIIEDDETRRLKLLNVEHLLLIMEEGRIKKLNRSTETDDTRDILKGDRTVETLNIENSGSLLVFDVTGKCYSLPVSDILPDTYSGAGHFVNDYIKTTNKIVKIMRKPEEDQTGKLLFITKNGMIKKSEVSNYTSANKSGLIGMTLKKVNANEKDEVVSVILLDKKNKDILLYTTNGKALRFNSKEVPITLRLSNGVISLKLDEDDKLAGVTIMDKKKKYLVIITSKGNGKKILIDNCTSAKRTGAGYTLIKLSDKEKIVGMKAIDDCDCVDVCFNNRIETLSASDIPTLTKIAKPIKLVPCKKGEVISSIH